MFRHMCPVLPSEPASGIDFRVTVRRRSVVAEGAIELVLEGIDGEQLPLWAPGAHVDLVLDDQTIRQYSLCGDPSDRTTYRVAVLQEQEGRGGSTRIHRDLDAGDTVMLRGPRNHFELARDEAYLFVAGGIGITPLLPMIREVDAAGLSWRLYYAGRQRATMAYVSELEALYPGNDGRQRVQVLPSAEVGRLDVDRVLSEAEPGSVVYCCGPESLLDAVEEASAKHGLPCHVERFTPRTIENAVDIPFIVRLASSGTELEVPADRTVLDVLFDADIDVITSCEEGTCGTCEVHVLEGVPDHRDSVLTHEERTACDRMMVCVSRSLSHLIVLDV